MIRRKQVDRVQDDRRRQRHPCAMAIRVSLLFPAACALAACAPSSVAGPVTAGDPAGARLAATVDDFLTRQSGFGWSGNVLLRVGERVVLAKGYGVADPAAGIAYSASTVFDIGSLAKQFTAAAVLRLEELGRLSVRDPIRAHLRDAPADKRDITIHQLLTHSSGLVADFPFRDPAAAYEDVSRDEALRRIFAAPLDFIPGRDAHYSNSGYIVLAAIVETAAGVPFRSFLRDEIFARAGLRHTTFWGDPALAGAPVAVGLDGYGAAVQDPRALSPTTWCDLGGGEVVSTLADLERWQRALRDGSVLSPPSVARLWTPWTERPLSRDGRYGYGWFIRPTPRKTTLIDHGGDVIAAGCHWSWYRDDDVLLITSTNVRHDLYPTRNAIDRPLPLLLFGGEVAHPPRWNAAPDLLDAAAGDYALPTGGTLRLRARGSRYFLGAIGQDAVELIAPVADAARARRAELTTSAHDAFTGLVRGDLEPLRRAAGPGNPTFPAAVAEELATINGGPLRSFTVLGTFASGFPRGDPPQYETTLVRLDGAKLYAIRWGPGVAIQATEESHLELAADTEVRATGPASLVAWDLLRKVAVPIAVIREGAEAAAGAGAGSAAAPVSGRVVRLEIGGTAITRRAPEPARR
jgi:CubicO group peptidase (beta-lactamase class C family)